MAGSSGSQILNPNIVVSHPRAKAIYNQVGSEGLVIQQPGGQQETIAQSVMAGLGATRLDQSGVMGPYGDYAMRMGQAAWQLEGPFTSMTANTTLLAPDVSPGFGAGGTSFQRVSPTADIDWVGGIATPKRVGASVFGTALVLFNVSNSGATVNILDISHGGAVRCPQPSVALGFLGWALFIYDNQGWNLVSSWSGLAFSGGFAQGSRVITVADNTPVYLMRWSKGAFVNGIAFGGDVSFFESSTGAQYTWKGTTGAWDTANSNYQTITDQWHNGNAAGLALVGGGVGLSLSDDSTYHRLMFTGANSHTLGVTANNFTNVSGPGI